MEGRSIHQNIRRAMDVVAHVNRQKTKAVVISIDFYKCFDVIDHQAILESFRYYGFAETFVHWISIFYNNFQVVTENAGYVSDPFLKTRGVNQGCNVSPFVFNVCGAIMKDKIKNNNKICGIKLSDKLATQEILSQFADDTAMFLIYDECCINAALEVLSCIERNTGLQVSYEKTCIYRIGSLKNSSAKCYTAKPLAWSDEDIQLLGVTITNGTQNNASLDSVINKMENVVNCWQNRQLSLIGKTLLINTLMGSLYVYQMSVLPQFTKKQLDKIYRLLTSFLWKDKRPKIPLKILQNTKSMGGLKLINFEVRQAASHINWIVKLSSDLQWQYVITEMLPEVGITIFKCNLNAKHCKTLKVPESFWLEILTTWCKYHHYEPQDQEEVLDQIIWYNSHLLVQGKPIKPTEQESSSTMYKISDILDENCKFLSLKEIRERHKIKIHWLRYANIIAAIPDYWKTLLKGTQIEVNTMPRLELDIICSKKQPSQYIYNYVIENFHATDVAKYADKWLKKLNSDIAITDFIALFKKIYKCTKMVKLQDFQYRLLLNKIYANETLYRWGKVDSTICNFCDKEIQTVLHMLCECETVTKVWEYIHNELLLNTDNVFSKEKIIFNTVNESNKHVANLLTLLSKQYIYQCKCLDKKPTTQGLLAEVTFMYKIEKDQAGASSKRIKNFNKKWEPVSLEKLFWY